MDLTGITLLPAAALVAAGLILGLLFGSFLNCAAMRIVRKEDWVRERSRCRSCGHVLSAGDLIPVLSFVLARGKCRYCGEKLSLRYPVTELLFGGITALLFARYGLTPELLRMFVLACCLFLLTLTDLEARLIPNGCLIAALIGYLATEPFLFQGWGEFGIHIAAMVGYAVVVLCLSLIMDTILKKESMGGGDIKLIGVLGLYLGVIGMMFALFAACILGILYALAARKLKRGQVITFGPFLAAAGFVMALTGGTLVQWYIDLIYRI
ncbi:MAG: prepilin peptidase [Lachnospiraceae bacterium]|nr:prepilin peptidase [Lachnospiraceae bacterium]